VATVGPDRRNVIVYTSQLRAQGLFAGHNHELWAAGNGCLLIDSAQAAEQDSRVEGGVQMLVGSEAVTARRASILATLLGRIDELTEAGVAAIRAEIPAYAAQRDERFLADLANQVRLVYSTNLSSMLEERAVTPDDIAFIRGAAMRRAEIGFALEDYLAAYRVGQQVLWDAIVDCAGESPGGHEAALTLAAPLMRFINFASTHAGQGHVEFRQQAVAEADRHRRDLLARRVVDPSLQTFLDEDLARGGVLSSTV